MTRPNIHKMVVLGLCVIVALFVTSTGQSQQSKKDKVKITGAQYKQRYSKYIVTAGVNKLNDCAWMVINFGDGRRTQYWHCRDGRVGSTNGTFRIVDDKVCNKWEIMGDQEQCSESYKIDEDKSELWIEQPSGEFKFAGTADNLQ